MLWSIDKNYSIEFYNQILKTLQFKNIDYNEYISTKNYKFYIETAQDPFILDYETIDPQFAYFLVSKTKYLQSQDSIKYTRRNEHSGKSALKLAYNDCFTELKDSYVYFIHIPNTAKAKTLSRDIGKLWYMGKYVGNRYKVYLTNNQYIPRFVKIDDILASGNVLDAEMELYYSAFNRLDRLKKYSRTPYFKDGEYFRPKVLAKIFGGSNE